MIPAYHQVWAAGHPGPLQAQMILSAPSPPSLTLFTGPDSGTVSTHRPSGCWTAKSGSDSHPGDGSKRQLKLDFTLILVRTLKTHGRPGRERFARCCCCAHRGKVKACRCKSEASSCNCMALDWLCWQWELPDRRLLAARNTAMLHQRLLLL